MSILDFTAPTAAGGVLPASSAAEKPLVGNATAGWKESALTFPAAALNPGEVLQDAAGDGVFVGATVGTVPAGGAGTPVELDGAGAFQAGSYPISYNQTLLLPIVTNGIRRWDVVQGTWNLFNNANAALGEYTVNSAATSVNDEIKKRFIPPKTATYNGSLCLNKYTDAPIIDVLLDGSTVLLNDYDTYAASTPSWNFWTPVFSLGALTVDVEYYLHVKVVGKHASSTDHRLTIHYAEIWEAT